MGIYGWCRSQGEFTDVGKLVDLRDDELVDIREMSVRYTHLMNTPSLVHR